MHGLVTMPSVSRVKRTSVVSLFVLAFFCHSAFAQGETSDTGGWTFDLAPMYLWAAGIDGNTVAGGQSAPLDVSFGDLLDELDFGGVVFFQGRKGRWGFFVDAAYAKFSSEGDLPGLGTFETGATIIALELAGFYRFGDERTSVDLIFGTRYMDMDTEISPPIGSSVSDAQNWGDAMVGGRVRTDLLDKWWLSVRADVSAGGSDLTWNLVTILGRTVSEKISWGFGYRIMDIDYEDGSGSDLFVLDAQMSGPMVGLNIHFE